MKTASLIVATFICGFVLLLASIPDYQLRKNCELAEISPDFTPQEKANCRIMRSKK